MIRQVRVFVLTLLAACGGSGEGDPVDAAPSIDGPPALAATCTGACAVTNAVATFGAGILPFERAYFGTTAGTPVTLHIEAYSGGEDGCQPATADATLILDVLPIPLDATSYTTTAGLVDLTGLLLVDQPTASTDDARVTPVAWEDGVQLAFDLSATFPDGTIIGHLAAQHCPEMDQ